MAAVFAMQGFGALMSVSVGTILISITMLIHYTINIIISFITMIINPIYFYYE